MTGNSRFAVSVHILAYLAYRHGAPVPSTEIAASVVTNPVVIRRLLAVLVKARIVGTQKGAGGGFSLAKEPQKISLLDIYRAVEPKPNYGLRNFSPNHDCPVGAKIEAILQTTFIKAHKGMEAELGKVTLQQIDKELRPVCPGDR
jgi:Rrf2 family protein